MKKDDTEFEELEDGDEDLSANIEPITLSARANRPRRSWRDIERMREQREMDKLMADDDWFASEDTNRV